MCTGYISLGAHRAPQTHFGFIHCKTGVEEGESRNGIQSSVFRQGLRPGWGRLRWSFGRSAWTKAHGLQTTVLKTGALRHMDRMAHA